jgi:long-chain acyl-CoA synthetase
MKRESVPVALFIQYQIAQKLALHKVREAFGGKVRFAISGGAPMPRDVANFFHACEVLILEGYGLTETTAAIAVNAPFDYRFGTVGKPVGDVKIKIAEDGEILVKSDKVMKEYYKNPEATREVFTDGWFHTGDIGEILSSGDIKITDRKKDLIKTGGGKYVAPQKIENLLKCHSFISQILVHGDQKKFIVALFTLDKPSILNFAKEKNIEFKDYPELTQNPKVLELVRMAVAETNKSLASYETIKRFAILPNDFSIETGELTPSLKIKRKVCDKKYKKEIDSLYS